MELKWNNMNDSGANAAIANQQAGLDAQSKNIYGMAGALTDFIDTAQKRFDTANTEAKERNAQLLINRMNQASSLEEIKAMQDSLNQELGTFGSNIDLGKVNTARKSWEVDTQQRNNAIMALRDTTPEAQSIVSKASELIRAGNFVEAEEYIQQNADKVSPDTQRKLISAVRETELADRKFLLESRLNEAQVASQMANANYQNTLAKSEESMIASKLAQSEAAARKAIAEASVTQKTAESVAQQSSLENAKSLSDAHRKLVDTQSKLEKYSQDPQKYIESYISTETSNLFRQYGLPAHVIQNLAGTTSKEKIKDLLSDYFGSDSLSANHLNLKGDLFKNIDTIFENVLHIGDTLQNNFNNAINEFNILNSKSVTGVISSTQTVSNSATKTKTNSEEHNDQVYKETQSQLRNETKSVNKDGQVGEEGQAVSGTNSSSTVSGKGPLNGTMTASVTVGSGKNAKTLNMTVNQDITRKVSENPEQKKLAQDLIVHKGLNVNQAVAVVDAVAKDNSIDMNELANQIKSVDFKPQVDQPNVDVEVPTVTAQQSEIPRGSDTLIDPSDLYGSSTKHFGNANDYLAKQDQDYLAEKAKEQENQRLAEQQQKQVELESSNPETVEGMKYIEDTVLGKNTNKDVQSVTGDTQVLNHNLSKMIEKLGFVDGKPVGISKAQMGKLYDDLQAKLQSGKLSEEERADAITQKQVLEYLNKSYPNGITADTLKNIDLVRNSGNSLIVQKYIEQVKNEKNIGITNENVKSFSKLVADTKEKTFGNQSSSDVSDEFFTNPKAFVKTVNDSEDNSFWDSDAVNALEDFQKFGELVIKDGIDLPSESKIAIGNMLGTLREYALNPDPAKKEIVDNYINIAKELAISGKAGAITLSALTSDVMQKVKDEQEQTLTDLSILSAYSKAGKNRDANSVAKEVTGTHSTANIRDQDARFKKSEIYQGMSDILYNRSEYFEKISTQIEEADRLSKLSTADNDTVQSNIEQLDSQIRSLSSKENKTREEEIKLNNLKEQQSILKGLASGDREEDVLSIQKYENKLVSQLAGDNFENFPKMQEELKREKEILQSLKLSMDNFQKSKVINQLPSFKKLQDRYKRQQLVVKKLEYYESRISSMIRALNQSSTN